MTFNTVVVPNVRADFVELSNAKTAKKVTGRLFKKQILHEGSFIHPNNPSKRVVIDKEFAQKLIDNFNNGACDIVQVPIVDDSNKHSEDPTRNIGEVVGLSYEEGVGVFAEIDARKHADELGKTIIGGSAMISMAYRDNDTGAVNSPVLLHVAATNRPYITNLESFQEVMQMSDTDVSDGEIVILSELESTGGAMSKDELIAALREHGIDVVELERRAAAANDVAAMSNLVDVDVKDSTLTLSDLAQAAVELDEKNLELTNQNTELLKANEDLADEVTKLKMSAAEAEIDKLIEEGKIFPKAREKMIELSVKDRETFDALVPDEAVVKLSNEQTVTTFENSDGVDEKTSAEVDRYIKMSR